LAEALVEVIPRNGRWVVRLIEPGRYYECDFGFEEFALAWAAGQTKRLTKEIGSVRLNMDPSLAEKAEDLGQNHEEC
jgi:hypothetical protein